MGHNINEPPKIYNGSNSINNALIYGSFWETAWTKNVTRTKKEEQTEQEEHEFFSISASF